MDLVYTPLNPRRGLGRFAPNCLKRSPGCLLGLLFVPLEDYSGLGGNCDADGGVGMDVCGEGLS